MSIDQGMAEMPGTGAVALNKTSGTPVRATRKPASLDILVTRRLTMRPPLEVDVDAITDALQDTDVTRMISSIPVPYTKVDAEAFIASARAGDGACFAIYRERFLGIVSISEDTDGKAGLGYWLVKTAWGQGYISEAARAVVSWYFRRTGVETIHTCHYEDNPASRAVLLKLGFEDCGSCAEMNATRQTEVATRRLVLTRENFERAFGALDGDIAA